MNQKYLRWLVDKMYAIEDSPVLDEYGSKIFGRPVGGTWRLFRHIARTAVADKWGWSSDKEVAKYPKDVEVPTFEEFATFMLHEVSHGWCYFLKEKPSWQNYPAGADEEQVCWDVSRLVCGVLGISYQEASAELCYKFHLFVQARDIEGIIRAAEKLPVHSRER
jgi:hypothetical protein